MPNQVIISGDQESSLSVMVDEPDANTTYVGEALAGADTSAAAWRIKQISVSGNVTTVNFADGDTNFDNVWDNRAILSYT